MEYLEVQKLLRAKGREFEKELQETNKVLFESLKEEAAKYLVGWEPTSEEIQYIYLTVFGLLNTLKLICHHI